jgi:hypothetical protein
LSLQKNMFHERALVNEQSVKTIWTNKNYKSRKFKRHGTTSH